MRDQNPARVLERFLEAAGWETISESFDAWAEYCEAEVALERAYREARR